MTRSDVLSEAVDKCLKEIYTYVQPKVTWDEFLKENKLYSQKYLEWETFNRAKNRAKDYPEDWESQKIKYPDWQEKSINDCIGLAPYNFYYLPKRILNNICESYVYSYKLDSKQNLLDIIKILKDYCKNPIVDKYVNEHTDENGDWHPGYRDYDHPDNLEKELFNLIPDTGFDKSELVKEVQNKFFEFLDMAGNFYNWNSELHSFNMSVYLGPSPNSNKETVIENWKKYKGVDIEINEQKIIDEFYGEDCGEGD